MAKTTYIEIPTELEEKYYQDLQSRDRFILPGMREKKRFISRQKKADLQSRTLLGICSDYWQNFTDAEKTKWKTVSPYDPQHGWRTFVADQTSRILLGLSGTTEPNQYHQDQIGYIKIEAPATETKLIQPHPSSYWIKTKVIGKDQMYKPEEITENLTLPLQIAISFKSNLTSTGAGSYAKLYASIRHLYQGENLNHNLTIDIPLQSHWDRKTETISDLIGTVTSYSLYIHLYNVEGELFFDNVEANHSGSNWARDTFCDNIEEDFTRAYFQVPKHWAPTVLPDGAVYYSKYVSAEEYTASEYGLKWYGEALYGEEA